MTTDLDDFIQEMGFKPINADFVQDRDFSVTMSIIYDRRQKGKRHVPKKYKKHYDAHRENVKLDKEIDSIPFTEDELAAGLPNILKYGY